MSKVKDYGDRRDLDGVTRRHVAIRCPGCTAADRQPLHGLDVTSVHKWNGDFERPTFEPSLMWDREHGGAPVGYVCHSHIKDGTIQFLGDCTHPLANQTVPLLDVEEFELTP